MVVERTRSQRRAGTSSGRSGICVCVWGGGVLGGRRRGEGTSTYSPFSDRLPEFAHLMYIFYFFPVCTVDYRELASPVR